MAVRRVDLAHLKPARGARKKPKRLGRGPGSGQGKTAGQGYKGQLSRGSGKLPYAGFEGGQMPLHRRLPKRGFTNIFRREVAIVNLGELARLDGEITPERLLAEGLVKKGCDVVKILGSGEIGKPLVVHAHRFSRSASDKIAAAGGRAEVIAPRARSAKRP
jgi:large subunit ribosomal protein L15